MRGKFLSDKNALNAVQDGIHCLSLSELRETFQTKSLYSADLNCVLFLSSASTEVSLMGAASGQHVGFLLSERRMLQVEEPPMYWPNRKSSHMQIMNGRYS